MTMIWAFVLAIVVFLLGLGLVMANKRLKLADRTTLIVLIVIPLVVLAVASGKVQEFSGPGGWSAKFQLTAKAGVQPTSITTEITSVVPKEEPVSLTRTALQLKYGTSIILTLTAGQTFYNSQLTRTNITVLQDVDPQLLIVLLDKTGQFFAMAEVTGFFSILRDYDRAETLFKLIRDDKLDELPTRKYPELIFDSLKENKTSPPQI
jgi:hypothetical protein